MILKLSLVVLLIYGVCLSGVSCRKGSYLDDVIGDDDEQSEESIEDKQVRSSELQDLSPVSVEDKIELLRNPELFNEPKPVREVVKISDPVVELVKERAFDEPKQVRAVENEKIDEDPVAESKKEEVLLQLPKQARAISAIQDTIQDAEPEFDNPKREADPKPEPVPVPQEPEPEAPTTEAEAGTEGSTEASTAEGDTETKDASSEPTGDQELQGSPGNGEGEGGGEKPVPAPGLNEIVENFPWLGLRSVQDNSNFDKSKIKCYSCQGLDQAKLDECEHASNHTHLLKRCIAQDPVCFWQYSRNAKVITQRLCLERTKDMEMGCIKKKDEINDQKYFHCYCDDSHGCNGVEVSKGKEANSAVKMEIMGSIRALPFILVVIFSKLFF